MLTHETVFTVIKIMRPSLTSKLTRQTLAWTCAGFLALGSLSASAERIYLNDVDITTAQLKNWTLKKVEEVKFDEKGDMYITAPGYNVKVVSGGKNKEAEREETPESVESTADDAQLSGPIEVHYDADVSTSHRFLLTLANPDRSKVPYDVDVLINGKHAVTYKHTRGNASQDVSEFITSGENTISFIARRVPGKSASGDHSMKVLLGVGSYDGKVAKYEHILVGMEYKSSDERSDVRSSQKMKVK